jgi:hypothetical protein
VTGPIRSQIFGFPVNMDEADVTRAKVLKDGQLRDLVDVIYDAQTGALAGLTPTADSMPYFTGATTADTTPITAFARTLLDDANAADARATLGVSASTTASGVTNDSGVSGATVAAALDTLSSGKQAASANLSSWSALATSAKADTSHVHSAADLTSGTLPIARLPAGSIVQIVETKNTGVFSTATTIPADNTVPQNTEGVEAFTLNVTPKESTSKILVECWGMFSASTTAAATFALFKDSDASAFAAQLLNAAGANFAVPFYFAGSFTAGTTSAITIKFRFGGNGTNTVQLNQINSVAYLDTSDGCHIKITEIKV